eukprot:CAMPEP_0195293576 /NCGR_PEP_ID=MMETSP0707-20130614/12802_1 /TAXON_ID=33640 /ORGANISM="Asterionellopsis glacialis, Strain CCMP134" /LENGTH=235 /DNA_ID=CAMNT_0040354323 /DNA_START=31 /DNA_END=738 /DNA_ORIENTATION=+
MLLATSIRHRLLLGQGKNLLGKSWNTACSVESPLFMSWTKASHNRKLLNKNQACVSSFVRYNSTDTTDQTTTTATTHAKMGLGPLNKEEELQEKERVAGLSDFQKEIELRDLDKQLARVNMLRRINTGELYTMRGQFKALMQDYGMPFMVWYWTIWGTTAVLTYGAINVFGVDAMEIISWADGFTGFDLTSKVDPTLGTIGLTIAVNELIEPLRLPFVVLTTKPIVKFITDRRLI